MAVRERREVVTTLGWPAIAGLASVLPFLLMEGIHRRGFDEPFPLPLFGLLWLLPAALVFVAMPLVLAVLRANGTRLHPPAWCCGPPCWL